MHSAYKLSALSSAVIAALAFAMPSMAAEAQAENAAVEETAVAEEEVVVRDTRAEAMTSFQQLNRQDIANRPQGDGNITDLLRSNPNVQFSNKSLNSLQMGDIKPADISIHGNLAYQNNFMIDGISVNSDLDPATQTDYSMTRLSSSDEQGFFIDSRLVESITVYDNNVPVEFGGFSGGVVDTETRSWSGENHFSVFARATEAGWSEMLVDPALKINSGDSGLSHPGQFQTDFEKRTYGFTGEFGISDNMGIVVGYTRRESKIPQIQASTHEVSNLRPNPDYNWENEEYLYDLVEVGSGVHETKQISDNLFVKTTMYLADETKLDVSFNYSGFENEGFLPTVNGSDFKDKHDAYGLTANLSHRFENALWTSSIAYNHMNDKRDSADSYLEVISQHMNQTPEDFSSETFMYRGGGYGDLESTQDVITGKTKLEFDPIQYQNTSHQFTVGADFSYTDAEYKRDKDFYRWMLNENYMHMDMGWGDPMDMIMQTPMTTRFAKGTHSADFMQLGLFAQHTMEAGDWTFRTGVRGEYDDFTEDFNFAPRFTASWDVWGNNATIASFGANRYYGRNIMAYALYRAQNAGLQHAVGADGGHGFASPDVEPDNGWMAVSDFEGLDSLKTPYDDELSLALTQRLPADWLANVTYVHRNGEKGIRSWQTGSFLNRDTTRHFANTGKTEHDSVTFSLASTKPMRFIGANHHVRFSAAWQETKSNMNMLESYNDADIHSPNGVFDGTHVILDGKLIKADDLDGTDFNIPIRLSLETTHDWTQYGITWFNFFRWDGSRDQVREMEDHTVDGVTYREYETVDFDSTWAWDTKLQYRPDWARGLQVSFEINNVTNNKNVADYLWYQPANVTDTTARGAWYDIYEPGRQFWLEVSYNY